MTTTVTTIAADLEAAEKDLALLERLNSAKKRVAQLTKDLEAAKASQARDEAVRAEEAAKARFQGFAGITVTDITMNGGGLLHRLYKITWKANAFSSQLGHSIPQERTVVGFHALPGEALAYLIEEHPERIPPAIMELAPRDPYRAFDLYFTARKRGYITGSVGQ